MIYPELIYILCPTCHKKTVEMAYSDLEKNCECGAVVKNPYRRENVNTELRQEKGQVS